MQRLRGRRLACVVVLASMGLLSVACGTFQSPVWDRPPCDSAQEVRAGKLQGSPALKDVPDGVQHGEDYRVLPCDDDDGIGSVGWSGMFVQSGEGAIRDHYKRALPPMGWSLKGESAWEELAPGQLDVGRPQLCFESEGEAGVILVIFLGGNARERQLFVEFRFSQQQITCANYLGA